MSKQSVQTYIKDRKEILSEIKLMIIERLNLDLSEEEIDNDSPLFGMGLGLDSIDALELVVGVEEGMNVTVPEGNLNIFRSINSLADFIMEYQKTEGGNGN